MRDSELQKYYNFSHQDAHQIFDVNLLGHLNLSKVLKIILLNQTQKIILLSSINAQFGTQDHSV